MRNKVDKIKLKSDDKTNGCMHEVSDWTFNRMTKEEQDNLMNLGLMIHAGSQNGGVGYEMLQKLQNLVSEMEDKYNPKKAETLFEMKRRLLKQGLK